MSFLFTNPLLLTALAGLGIPLLIHLLLKRKSQKLRFSTVRFFVQRDEKAASKRRLRNLLLLLLRLLIFALLVLAFARPFWPQFGNGANGPPPRQVVFVVDTSASLQTVDSGGVRWERARKLTRDALAALRSADRAALVFSGPQATVATGFSPASVVARLLEDVSPTAGSGDLAAGLRAATRLIQHGDPRCAFGITLVSDLQRASALNLNAAPVPAQVEFKVLSAGDLAVPNVAVVELNLETMSEGVPHTTVANYGDEDFGHGAEFVVDGKASPLSLGRLRPGESTNLELTLPALKAGWHSAEVRLGGTDALALDNSRYAAFFVPEPVRVLLVEGRHTRRSFDEQSFFVAAALDPAFGTTNVSTSRFVLRQCGPQDLESNLSAASPTNRPEVVVLPAQRSLSPGAGRALAEYVQGGGGLLLWLGAEISANRFNLDFANLSPGVLRAEEVAEGESVWRMGDHDVGAAVFASFRQPESGNLALPGFRHRYAVTPAAGSRVRARFDDAMPLLIEQNVGRGRVLLVNTTPDTAWSDWPKRKSFVPWIHDTAGFLAARRAEDSVRQGARWVAGVPEDLDLGSTSARAAVRWVGPAKQESRFTPDDQGRISVDPKTPGIYSLRDAAGVELRRVAVNVPAAESDLLAWRPEEFQKQVVRGPDTAGASLSASLFGENRNQRELWRVLLWGALALLLAETIFSNRSTV